MTETETKKQAGEHLLDLSKPTRKNERWTLLLVGASGRIIRVRRIRGWLTLLMGLPVIILALAAGVYLRSDIPTDRDRRVSDKIKGLKAQVRALTDENTRQAARFAAKEKMEAQAAPVQPAPEPETVTAPKKMPAPTPMKDPGPQLGELTTTQPPVTESVAARQVSAPPDALSPRIVEVKDLKVSLDQSLGSARVRFKIINRLPNDETFSGYAFVILKPDALKPEQWVSFPAAVLASGVPVSFRRGYNFNISNFMYIRFKPRRLGAVGSFQKATVLVYGTSGQLLLSTDFELSSRLRQ